MKNLNKQSKMKILATTSALIGIYSVGTGITGETASASPTRVPTVNASTQTNSPSLGNRLWNGIKKPFTNAGKLFGRAWNSAKNCFGLKSSSSKSFDFEMQPVSDKDKHNALRRGTTPPYGNKNDSKINISSNKSNQSDIIYADLDFTGISSSNGVRPRKEPETIYAQIKTKDPNDTPNQLTVSAEVHPQPNNNHSNLPKPTKVKLQAKSGVNNKGFDENEIDDNIKPTTFYGGYLKPTKDTDTSKKSESPVAPLFDTDGFGYNPKEDPIHQPLSDFLKTSQKNETSSTSSNKGIGKPPVPAPRTKLLPKQ